MRECSLNCVRGSAIGLSCLAASSMNLCILKKVALYFPSPLGRGVRGEGKGLAFDRKKSYIHKAKFGGVAYRSFFFLTLVIMESKAIPLVIS